MKWQPYPKYKNSGVEWLGDVPEGWEIKQMKWISSVQRGASPRPIDDPVYFEDDGEYSWVRIADVTASDKYLNQTTQRLSELGSSLSVKIFPNQLFLSIAATVGKPCIAKIKCCIHDGFVHFPQLKENTEFMFYIFACGQSYLGLGKLGTQLNLNTDTVGSIKIALPPHEEQQAIATFLDKETNRIDALIAKKKALVEKLKEQRTAIISNAVTKGLSADVAPRYGLKPHTHFKPSGVDWLGDVPEGWMVKRLKEIVKEPLLYGANASSEESNSYEPRYIRITDISPDGSLCPESYRSLPMETAEPYLLRDGDILLARSGATVGKSFLYKESYGQCCFAGYLIRARVNKKIASSNFVLFIMQSIAYWQYIASIQIQATIQNVSADKYNELLIPLPSLKEQQAITAYLDEQTGKIDALIAKLEQAITTLQEYRTALITAAVTGKIDVRHEAGMQEIS